MILNFVTGGAALTPFFSRLSAALKPAMQCGMRLNFMAGRAETLLREHMTVPTAWLIWGHQAHGATIQTARRRGHQIAFCEYGTPSQSWSIHLSSRLPWQPARSAIHALTSIDTLAAVLKLEGCHACSDKGSGTLLLLQVPTDNAVLYGAPAIFRGTEGMRRLIIMTAAVFGPSTLTVRPHPRYTTPTLSMLAELNIQPSIEMLGPALMAAAVIVGLNSTALTLARLMGRAVVQLASSVLPPTHSSDALRDWTSAVPLTGAPLQTATNAVFMSQVPYPEYAGAGLSHPLRRLLEGCPLNELD